MTPSAARRQPARFSLVIRLARLTLLTVALIVAAPVAASAQEIGDKGSPDPLTAVEFFGYFFGIPILILLICVAIFMRPGSGGSSRYRPNRGWDANEAWFGRTPAADGATPTADQSDATGGGSRGSW